MKEFYKTIVQRLLGRRNQPEKHWISPHYDSSKLKNPGFDDLVDVFEDRMMGWMMDWAECLNKKRHAGFAVLHIGIAYFESIAVFMKGQDSYRHSGEFFKDAFREVFPSLLEKGESIVNQVLDLMYSQGRCGFYHSGMAKKEIGLQDGDLFTIIEKDGNVDSVRIDRYKFIAGIKQHLNNYVKKLKNPVETTARENFIKGWNLFHQ